MSAQSRIVASEAMQTWNGLQRSSTRLSTLKAWAKNVNQNVRNHHDWTGSVTGARSPKLDSSGKIIDKVSSRWFLLSDNGVSSLHPCHGNRAASFSGIHRNFSTSVSAFSDANKTSVAESQETTDPHAEEQEREHVFSPLRDRDIVERLDSFSHHMSLDEVSSSCMQASEDLSNSSSTMDEVSNYEGHNSMGGVNLSGVMQSNVPEPFQSNLRGTPSHMNMPGGGCRRQDKYLQGHIKDVHPSRQYSTTTAQFSRDTDAEDGSEHLYMPYSDMQGLQGDVDMAVRDLAHLENPCPQGVQGSDCENFKLWLNNCIRYDLANCDDNLVAFKAGRKTLPEIFAEQEKMIRDAVLQQQKRHYSTSRRLYCPPSKEGTDTVSSGVEVKLSQKDKLKRAVKEYGGTVIVFHVTISLMSLGTAYLAVSSGLDVVGLLEKMGVGQSILESRLATGTSTFVVAYAVHKVFAPARIAITLTCTPFIVRHLRRIGFLKPPKVPKP